MRAHVRSLARFLVSSARRRPLPCAVDTARGRPERRRVASPSLITHGPDMSTPLSLELDSTTLAEQYDRLGTRQFHHGLELLDALDVQRGEKVLDIGCGTGLLTEAAAERTGPDGKVLGIDPLALRVELAKKRAQGRFEARAGRAEALDDGSDQHYDGAYFNS